MSRTTKEFFGGQDHYDFTNAHPDFREGLERYSALVTERIAYKRANHVTGAAHDKLRIHVARRGVDWIARELSGLAPDRFTRRHAEQHYAYVIEKTHSCANNRTVNGLRGLFEFMGELGLRDKSLGDPFAYLQGRPKPVLPKLDEDTQTLYEAIEDHIAFEIEQKISSHGLEGISEDHGNDIVCHLRMLLGFMAEHNEPLPEDSKARWPMTFTFLYDSTEPMATFLRESPAYGATRVPGKLSEKSRQARHDNLMHVYEVLQRREPPVGAKDFRERLTKIFKPAKNRPMYFGGPAGVEVEALEEEDVRAILRVIDSRVAEAKSKIRRGLPSGRDDLGQAYLAGFTTELRIWTGIRNKGAASFDLAELEQLENGSWIGHKVVRKARNSSQTKDWWVPQRAIRWLRLYLKVKGYALVEEDLTAEKRRELEAIKARPMPKEARERAIKTLMFGPGVFLQAHHDRLADITVGGDRTIYPAVRDAKGNALSPRALAEVVSRVLKDADCKVTIAHILRHTMCSLYLNKYHRSPREIMTIADWVTETMVVRLYPKREFKYVIHDFDRLTAQVCQTVPQALGSKVVREALRAAIDFLTRCLSEDGQRQLSQASAGLKKLMDTLAQVDPKLTPPSELIWFTRAQFDELDRQILEQTGRKLSLRKLLGGKPAVGLPEPQLPVDAPSIDDTEDEAA